MKDSVETRLGRMAVSEAEAEERFWKMVARQRGGENVAFRMQKTSVPAYPGAPRELGPVSIEYFPVAVK